MKRILLNGMLALGFMFSINAVSAQAVSKGNIIIDPYYGAPNFGKKLADLITFDNPNVRKGQTGGIGPAGLRVEYMLADKFGLGVDVIYNSTTVDMIYDSLNTDGSLYKTYTGQAAMNRLRVQARFNYHFVSTDELDAYFGVGAGSNARFWTVTTNDPGYDFERSVKGAAFPVSMRLAVGMRYYFIPNLGFNAEIGLGGPVVSAGLSLKF